METIVRVYPKKPKPRGQTRGVIYQRPVFEEKEYPIKRKKSQVQQHMEEELERQIKKLEKKKEHP